MAIVDSTGSTWAIGSGWPWPRMWVTSYYLLSVAINGSSLFLFEIKYSTNGTLTAYKVTDLGLVADITSVSIADFLLLS